MAPWRESRPLRIVVAEDDPDDRLLLAEALDAAELDSDVRFLEDGAQLLDYLRRSASDLDSPGADLVVLDLNMPRKDGRTALREIKAEPGLRSLPVVVLTTSSAERDADGYRRAGACAYVVKPASFTRLVEAVRMFPFYVVRPS